MESEDIAERMLDRWIEMIEAKVSERREIGHSPVVAIVDLKSRLGLALALSGRENANMDDDTHLTAVREMLAQSQPDMMPMNVIVADPDSLRRRMRLAIARTKSIGLDTDLMALGEQIERATETGQTCIVMIFREDINAEDDNESPQSVIFARQLVKFSSEPTDGQKD